MSDPRVTVKIALNFEPFKTAMQGVVKAMAKFVRTYNLPTATHQQRHHARELPARSVLHAKYDQRRRARRRRRRT